MFRFFVIFFIFGALPGVRFQRSWNPWASGLRKSEEPDPEEPLGYEKARNLWVTKKRLERESYQKLRERPEALHAKRKTEK